MMEEKEEEEEGRMSAFDRFAGQRDLCLLISESVVQKFTFNCKFLFV